MDEKELYSFLKKKIRENGYYEELDYEPLDYFDNKRLMKVPKLHIGLINIPCEGFGDIVNCAIFYKTLKDWYPNIRITICTSELYKFQTLQIKNLKFLELIKKQGKQECGNYGDYRFKKKPKEPFDIIGVVPLILSEGMEGSFKMSHLQKLIPYATRFNVFNVSEYNGESPPYTFPLGVGRYQMGLLLSDMEIPEQTLIKKPFALSYIQESPNWGPHSNTCILSFIEMICKKYNHHKTFQLIIPNWFHSLEFESGIFYSASLKTRLINIVKQYFDILSILHYDEDGKRYKKELYKDKKNNKLDNELILRGDILPQPRIKFISLMKDSVEDILLTGDQSITDALSYCRNTKRIWYQVAPWKQDFGDEVGKSLPNAHLGNFRTTCGTLRSIRLKLNNKELKEKYDFRKLGKQRMDSVILLYLHRHEALLRYYFYCVEHSNYKETLLNKFQKYKII